MRAKESIEKLILEVKEKLQEEPEIASEFARCYKDTLEKTVKVLEDGTSYVITGDIPAMWLRDSAAQVRPYLGLAGESEELRSLLVGLCRRQFAFINIDPYANAFNEKADGSCWREDLTWQHPQVWERKYEIDSLCYPVQLAWLLWKNAGCTQQFDQNFEDGLRKILRVLKTEQRHEEDSEYSFVRTDTYFTDTLSRDGKGALVKSGVGLTWSGFRPSDDSCTYGYLIPSNMFAVVILGYAAQIAEEIFKDQSLSEEAAVLREEIRSGIETFGVTEKEGYGKVYAYETDGYGQYNLMDDANVPSLLSMEYLGYHPKSEEIATNTRKLILSEANPYYYRGTCGAGIGSPHTPVNYIWPIALAVQGITSKKREEKLELLRLMVRTDGGSGMMHEGFLADDPSQYTREWFSWANAMFCELVLDYCGYEIRT